MNQPETHKTAIAYVRVRSDEQVDGLWLASQEQKIKEWFDSRDFDLLAVFRDEGESACTDEVAKRPVESPYVV